MENLLFICMQFCAVSGQIHLKLLLYCNLKNLNLNVDAVLHSFVMSHCSCDLPVMQLYFLSKQYV